jgi:predicted transcriptional regulator
MVRSHVGGLYSRTVLFAGVTSYRLYVLHKVRQGMQDVEAGRGISSEELVREIERW